MKFKEYPKIQSLFKRDPVTKKIIFGEYVNPAVEFLAENQWFFTEKIDGMNCRIMWDGYAVQFRGRTDRAEFNKKQTQFLEETFLGEDNAQLFEQIFGKNQVILYGELYGAGIQKGGNYRKDIGFILFDVLIEGDEHHLWWLERHNVEEVGKSLGLDVVPVLLTGTIKDGLSFVESHINSSIGTAILEGIVGQPLIPLIQRNGERIIVKIKGRDFV